ncbi:exodeoxyribonuclease VII large subunit [Candidatus Uhrbacteria bacterium RIFCSPHIGHO2_02_FULL_47_44]|uniref:Exodeoxyribonuclease 7 large subunit n=1 Tax=Candidatus Uhrbacteria bacterium RIFCSPLOWO2_02_FULL_48_18 TaxID=1802408 RepID=A0A1F7V8Z5_9BACT|nr:MAG: exodeoxyribonuclease VII large subunit [Candidatus Uhrbacteria bacterium RIFCSPHIGHO2_02_FULL_47_44]OGL81807.1 MAG: exodeoxyribonuclease VII large subunit [Candidatus Uhrbacteria bacterium RIFCSPLOWO2_01_FULL_47_17]OGL86970.1 MAG: exodeoxyribonuclease VII large subunit [Candidatus Uhrbacteria bacterium RIFCSPLOWO2_02_FULL_48_18]
MEPVVLHVADYLALLNEVLHDRVPSNEILIEGEVSDYRVAQQKWVSFDLKDEKAEAVLKCFATVWQIGTPIEDGMRVHVKGFPKMYERFGTLKLNVQSIEPIGEGALKRAYDLLKKKLEVEGLFDVSRKRTLPRFPKKIGLITSRDAAAYGDFLRIVNNRWGGIEIDHAHVHVQGREAVPEILGAFRHFNALPLEERPDAIVLTRGGGGLEDLHAFNDEQVARAVYQSIIPVVVAVGHERDESLADYVADIRASTPSNAAERVVPSRADVKYEIDMMLTHNEQRLQFVMDEYRTAAEKIATRVGHILERERERLVMINARLHDRAERWLPLLRESVESSARMLRQVDPTRILARGYAIVRIGGEVVKDASLLAIGREVAIQLGAGAVDAEVLRVNGKGKQKLV